MAFDPFGDYATRGYLRNVAGELDPERVKRLEHRSFSANVLTALVNLQGVRQLRYEDVLDTHERCSVPSTPGPVRTVPSSHQTSPSARPGTTICSRTPATFSAPSLMDIRSFMATVEV
jgi:hypothetical protein